VGFRFAYHAFLVVWSNIPPLFGSLIRHVANVHWPEGHGNAYRLYGSSKLGVVCYIYIFLEETLQLPGKSARPGSIQPPSLQLNLYIKMVFSTRSVTK
jgi:hypothetical protein